MIWESIRGAGVTVSTGTSLSVDEITLGEMREMSLRGWSFGIAGIT